jgi:hypothetical protein
MNRNIDKLDWKIKRLPAMIDKISNYYMYTHVLNLYTRQLPLMNLKLLHNINNFFILSLRQYVNNKLCHKLHVYINNYLTITLCLQMYLNWSFLVYVPKKISLATDDSICRLHNMHTVIIFEITLASVREIFFTLIQHLLY